MQVEQLLLGGTGTICAVVGVVVRGVKRGLIGWLEGGIFAAGRTAQELQELAGATRPWMPWNA
jgi:hypothetical protein